KKKRTTRFDSVESAIHQKLKNVLSFDSTPCERFAWMEHLSEEEFDALDPSFHELLPKSRLIFSGESPSSARQKLERLAPFQSEPYSTLKVIGSLNAHTLLLPTPDAPFGAFLAEEQRRFLDTEFTDTVTTLYGASGSGKSTLILRKAIKSVLENPKHRVLIITPTLLAGELLRNKLVSLIDYGAFAIPMDAISFYTPQLSEPLRGMAVFEEASIVFCDDAYRMDSALVEMLKQQRKKRWLMISTAVEPDSIENLYVLLNHYRDAKVRATVECTEENLMFTLMMELRKRLCDTPAHDVMVVLPEQSMLLKFKYAIDEYFHLNSRMLIPGFSLQYQNLDDLILATADSISGLRIPHLVLIVPENTDDYTFALSRASESATLIAYRNGSEENDPKPHQKES
ncbi:MAG: ATP-binding protein, partial [Campylobacterales bacterium]|nr:ATP-binding protein [Campylobacterales bacterium]